MGGAPERAPLQIQGEPGPEIASSWLITFILGVTNAKCGSSSKQVVNLALLINVVFSFTFLATSPITNISPCWV